LTCECILLFVNVKTKDVGLKEYANIYGSHRLPKTLYFIGIGLKGFGIPASKGLTKGGERMKSIQTLVVAAVLLAFSGLSLGAPATPATPATPASPALEKKAEGAAKEEKGKAKAKGKVEEKGKAEAAKEKGKAEAKAKGKKTAEEKTAEKTEKSK
jgi:hypothetical protein